MRTKANGKETSGASLKERFLAAARDGQIELTDDERAEFGIGTDSDPEPEPAPKRRAVPMKKPSLSGRYTDDGLVLRAERTEGGNLLLRLYGEFRPVSACLSVETWLSFVGLAGEAISDAQSNFAGLPLYVPKKKR